MSKHTSLIVIISIVLLGLGLIIYLSVRSSPGNPANNSATPTQISQGVPTGDLIDSIPVDAPLLDITGQLGHVETANFLQNVGIKFNGYAEFYRDPEYVLGFDGPSQQFSVNLQANTLSDYNRIRAAAESKFLEMLDISQISACHLKVQEQNFAAGDPAVSYKTSGLSFCESQ